MIYLLWIIITGDSEVDIILLMRRISSMESGIALMVRSAFPLCFLHFSKFGVLIYPDSIVRPANPEDCVTAAAYLLFYTRRSDSPLGGNTSRLIAEYLAQVEEEQNKAAEEEGEDGEDERSSSTTTSPKLDGEEESSSSSSPFPGGTSKAFKTSLLTPSKYTTIDHQMTPTTWGGGWSNRTNRAYLNSTSHNPADEANVVDQPMYTDPETEMLGMDLRAPDDDDVDLISTGPEDRDINPEGNN